MGPLLRGARAIWRVLWRSKQLDADMQEEMHFHLQMEADRLAQAHGLDPQEARRQAFVRFGGVDKYKEQGREIGIRSALGAQPRQLLLGVFGRAMRQLSIGLVSGR